MGDPFQLWELRNPDGGPTGLEWARAKIGIVDRVLLHAAPERVDVQIYDEAGGLVAQGRSPGTVALGLLGEASHVHCGGWMMVPHRHCTPRRVAAAIAI